MTIAMTAGFFLLAYLLGSIPTSIIAGRISRGIDIREHGSGNAGATNTVRVLGVHWGVLVGLVDLAKGWLAVALPMAAGVPEILLVLIGIAAVAGHAFPLFAGFRGGKGVATGAGMVLALFPWAFLVCIGLWLAMLFLFGMVSVGSILAAAALPVGVLFLEGGFAALTVGDATGIAVWIFSLLIGLGVIWLHRQNIGRILNGSERRFEKIALIKKKQDDVSDDNDGINTE